MRFLPYRILAALLYPNRASIAQATSWEDRQFYLRAFAKANKCKPVMLKTCLEYLRQAGFIQKIIYGKDEGWNGRVWVKVKMVMPSEGLKSEE